jgi:hypothetical protein
MKDKENIIGLMEEVILENGKIIKWMVKEYWQTKIMKYIEVII